MRKLSDANTPDEGADPAVENPSTDEALADRLQRIIGSESVASFARRSGVGESLLRKYLNGALPNSNNLVLLADAGGCYVDWLASGRPPRMRADRIASTTQVDDKSVAEDEFYCSNVTVPPTTIRKPLCALLWRQSPTRAVVPGIEPGKRLPVSPTFFRERNSRSRTTANQMISWRKASIFRGVIAANAMMTP